MSNASKQEVFEFLDHLRDSGDVTNMFEAVPHLMKRFDIGTEEAREFVYQYMEGFS